MRILSEEDVRKRIAETVGKINSVKRIKASNRQLELVEAEKSVWRRVLYHIKNGEMMTIDDEDRIEWHVDAPAA